MQKRRKINSMAHREHTELAWALYVTEGYLANVAHLRTVNNYTLSPRALKALDRAVAAAQHTADDLRREIKLRSAK